MSFTSCALGDLLRVVLNLSYESVDLTEDLVLHGNVLGAVRRRWRVRRSGGGRQGVKREKGRKELTKTWCVELRVDRVRG